MEKDCFETGHENAVCQWQCGWPDLEKLCTSAQILTFKCLRFEFWRQLRLFRLVFTRWRRQTVFHCLVFGSEQRIMVSVFQFRFLRLKGK